MSYNSSNQKASFQWSSPIEKNGIIEKYTLIVQATEVNFENIIKSNQTETYLYQVIKLCRDHTGTINATTAGGTGPATSSYFQAIPASILPRVISFTFQYN